MKNTIIDLFEESVKKYSNNTLLLEKKSDKFEPTTYLQIRDLVYALSSALIKMGVESGDRISILSEGRNDWIISELALLYAGAVSVPLSIKLEESNDLMFRLVHADVKAIFVSSQQLKKIRTIKNQLPELKHIISFDPIENPQADEVYIGELYELGAKEYSENSNTLHKRAQSIKNDDFATITYTSGTTSDPKGVVLTHRNYTANVEQALTKIDIPDWYRTLIILPLDHCFAHVVGFYIIIKSGATAATVQVGKTAMDTLKNIPTNIREVKPHFILSVPAIAKNFKKSIESSIRAKGATTEKLFNFALRVAYAYNRDGYTKGSGVSCLLKPLVKLFDKILFTKVREAFGGELKFFVGGGALLDSDLQRFFYAIGIPMYQGYGLSEATPIISTNAPVKHKFGTSGTLVQPLDIKIVDTDSVELPIGQSGEIVVRGENVMWGYWKNPKSTAETIRDGWLYTGDMGYMSSDGFLYVLGRFKSLLIAGDGEKYSPEAMEEAFVSMSAYIDQVILHNNQNPYTIALFVVNRDAITRHFKAHHHAFDWNENSAAERAVKLIQAEVDKFKRGGEHAGMFPERWLPATFAIISEPFTEQNHLVNSTMKIMRNKVEERYKDRIEYLYTPEGKNIFNSQNYQAFM